VGKLAGGIAHDFNNLLAVILNYADVALQDTGDDVRTEIAEIKRAAERAAALTRQLLLFSRKNVTPEGTVHAEEVVAGMEAILGRALGEHLRLELRVETGLPPVRIAESLLEQVLLNLVLNAGDAMPNGGAVVVELAAAEPGVRLSVIDSGTGMTPEVVDRAFEPFFTTKPEGRGTGLGLATCYGILQRAGGRIEIDSTAGEGTRIDVYLEAGVDPGPSEAEEPRPPGGSETVLVVEDEEPLRNITRRILEGAGYTVLTAESPAAALEIWRRSAEDVDVLLTDVVMPERSGMDLWRELVAERPGLVAIFMSGYSADAVATDDASGRIMLEKPFTSAELLAAVREGLGS
jgi:CheY-like chemotaxis protein